MKVNPIKFFKQIDANTKLVAMGVTCMTIGFGGTAMLINEIAQREQKAKKEEFELTLKMDSIAQVNYAKGMQAIRDSIKNADKN